MCNTNININARFGARLRAQRLALGMTSEQFALCLGITRPVLSRYEHGHSGVTLATLYRFAERLNISPHELMP
jgi:transcriptional regulator with XRE-family HTH domain